MVAQTGRSFARALRTAAQAPQQQSRNAISRKSLALKRGYATAPNGSSSNSTALIGGGLALAALGGGVYYYSSQSEATSSAGKVRPDEYSAKVKNAPSAKEVDYQKVYNAVADLLEDNDYDDGSYGPVLIRLAWHASGTYDKETGNGGSNGATMRFAPEANHGANAGLIHARDRMEIVKKQFPEITYSDLWTLGGVAAVQEMGGPIVPWKPGRQDGFVENCTPDGRLPDGDKGSDHLRKIFYRQGFNDQEIVALSGAHALGRCHTDRSGFDGPWSFSPTTFTNDYFKLLFDEKWQFRKWNGPIQYEDKKTKSLMMLTTDMALITDKSFRKTAELYAKDQDAFFNDFSAVFAKLLENGVPTKNFADKPTFRFKRIEDQQEEAKAKA